MPYICIPTNSRICSNTLYCKKKICGIWQVRIDIQFERIRANLSHSEIYFRRSFRILFNANRLKINPTHSGSIKGINLNEFEPSFQYESI